MVTPTQPTPILIPRIRSIKTTSPWEYVDNWAKSDREPENTLKKLNERMQNRWPGKYCIVEKEVRSKTSMYRHVRYEFLFDTPKDETWFRLQYS